MTLPRGIRVKTLSTERAAAARRSRRQGRVVGQVRAAAPPPGTPRPRRARAAGTGRSASRAATAGLRLVAVLDRARLAPLGLAARRRVVARPDPAAARLRAAGRDGPRPRRGRGRARSTTKRSSSSLREPLAARAPPALRRRSAARTRRAAPASPAPRAAIFAATVRARSKESRSCCSKRTRRLRVDVVDGQDLGRGLGAAARRGVRVGDDQVARRDDVARRDHAGGRRACRETRASGAKESVVTRT